MLALRSTSCKRFQGLESRLKRWRQTVHKHTQEEEWMRVLQETDTTVTPIDIAQMKTSPWAMQGIRALHQANTSGIITAETFVVIIAVLNVENGSKQAPIQDKTIHMYSSARQDPNTGKKVVILPSELLRVPPNWLCPLKSNNGWQLMSLK